MRTCLVDGKMESQGLAVHGEGHEVGTWGWGCGAHTGWAQLSDQPGLMRMSILAKPGVSFQM